MRYKIDYLSFTIKPDRKAEHRKAGSPLKPLAVKLMPLLYMLGLSDRDIEILFSFDHGAHRCYDHTYIHQGIHVYAVDMSMTSEPISDFANPVQLEKYFTYGINIEMKGSGCRYFEKLHNDDPECYRNLFGKLLSLVVKGASLNICRIDFAFDDKVRKGEYDGTGNLKQGLLDLDVINSIINNKVELENKLLDSIEVDTDGTEIFSSIYRTYAPTTSSEKLKYYDTDTGEFRSRLMTGTTVYFGSRESGSYCKFYDKLVEEHSNNKDDLLYLRDELSQYSHWVRFEFTFKDENAIKIVNAYLAKDDKSFMSFISSTINSYIRFLLYDNKNITRCTIAQWWADFIDSVDHAKISVAGLSVNPAAKALSWVGDISNMLNALMHNMGADALIAYIKAHERPDKYTGRHRAIMEADDLITTKQYSDLDKWISNMP